VEVADDKEHTSMPLPSDLEMPEQLKPRSKQPNHRVFIEVSRLVDDRLTHTGIARYGRELLRHLALMDNDEVWGVVTDSALGPRERNDELASELLDLLEGRLITLGHGASIAEALSASAPLTAKDVYHSIHLPLPPPEFTGAAGRVLTVHDVLHLRRPDLYVPAGPPAIRSSIDSLTQHDIVLCDSAQTRIDFLMITKHPGDQTFTVPLGCTLAPQVTSVDSRLGITCLLQKEPRKNNTSTLDALAEVLAEMPETDGPKCIGHVFAPGDYWVEIAHTVMDKAGVEPSFFNVMADADDEHISSALANSRAFLWGSTYEGFGLPVLEAMAHGTVPVLAPNSSHIEVAGDSGAYAPSTDSASLARVLKQVLSDSAYALRLSHRAIHRARLLSWHKTARGSETAYTKARQMAEDRAVNAP
jgi:glycosyltransferase involved in cell wall biosynthesis